MGKFKNLAISEESALMKHIKKDWPGATVSNNLIIQSADGTLLAKVIQHDGRIDIATGTTIITNVEYNVEPNIVTNPNASHRSKFNGILFEDSFEPWNDGSRK